MRFRLRDMLLLMLMLGVYLTTASQVLQLDVSPQYKRGLLLFAVTFVMSTLAFSFLGLRWSRGKAGPIVVSFVPPIPWKALLQQLLVIVAFGIAAIYFDRHPTGVAAFTGASIPILVSICLVFLFNTLSVSSAGIIYHCMFRGWDYLEVLRSEEGTVEAIELWNPRWQPKNEFVLKYLWPGVTITIPKEHQPQLTKLYNQYSFPGN